MIKIIGSRIGFLLGAWILASLLIFFTLRMLPGDVAQIIGGTGASAARVAQLREELGLNLPLWEQYLTWLGNLITGNLGTSLVSGTPVSAQLLEKSAVSLPLIVLSMSIALAVALPLGIYTAYKRGSKLASLTATAAYAGAAVPPVWVALILIGVFASFAHLLPAGGFPAHGWGDPLRAFVSLLLPALTIGLIEAAVLFRFVRSATLSALAADPVRTGMSFGHTRAGALVRYGMPQVALSLLGTLGIQLAGLVVGAVVIEQLFNLPGIGSMLVGDIGARDLPKVGSTLMLVTGFILLLGTLLDTAAQLLDPRLRDRKRGGQ